MLSNKKDSFSFAQSTESESNSKLFNIDVLCINCSEMINCDEIDSHSRLCNKVSKKVCLMENSNIIDQINFKIEKMLNSIEKLDFEMKVQNNKNYKFYNKTKKEDIEALDNLKDLIKKIYIVNAINLDNIKILKDYALKIHHIVRHFSGSPGILIYLERVKNLTKEKYQEMAQIDINYIKNKNETLSNYRSKNPGFPKPLQTINEKESIISVRPETTQNFTNRDKSRNHFEKQTKQNYYSESKKDEDFNRKTKIFNNFSPNINDYLTHYAEKSKGNLEDPGVDVYSNFSRSIATHEDDNQSKNISMKSPSKASGRGIFHIDEISSDVNKRAGLNTSQGSLVQTEISKQKSKISNQDNVIDPFTFQPNVNKKKLDSDELQRFFYTKCLNAKMKFGSDSKVQRVSIALIYKEAMDKKVPQGDWNSFIDNALKYPDKYLDLTKLKMRSTKKVLQNRLVEFSQDKQYKEKIQK